MDRKGTALVILCWRIEVRYLSEGGNKKTMQSDPLTWTDARAELNRLLNMKHDAAIVEIPEATAKHREAIARERSVIGKAA